MVSQGRGAGIHDSPDQSRLHVRRGVGVAEDNIEAARWYRAAAEGGHARAQTNLGYLYAHGLGVPQDQGKR